MAKENFLKILFFILLYFLSLWLYPIFRWQDSALSFFLDNKIPIKVFYFYYFKNPAFLNFFESLLLGFVPLTFLKHPYALVLPHLLNIVIFIFFIKRFPYTFWLFLAIFSPVEQGLVLLFINFFLFLEKTFYLKKYQAFLVGFTIALLYPLCGLSFFVFQVLRFFPKKKRMTLIGVLIALLSWSFYLLIKQKFSLSLIFSYSLREEIFPTKAYWSLENPFIYLWLFFAMVWLVEVFGFQRNPKWFYFFLALVSFSIFYLSRANNPLWPVLFFAILFLKSQRKYQKLFPLLGIIFYLPTYTKKEIAVYPEQISGPAVVSLENPYQKLDLLTLRNQKTQIYLLDLYLVPEHVKLALEGFGQKTKVYLFSQALRNYFEHERDYADKLIKKLLKEKNLFFVYAGTLSNEEKPYRRIQEIYPKFTNAKILYVSLQEF